MSKKARSCVKLVVWFGMVIAATSLSTQMRQEQWKRLFDGKDLDGWEHVGPGRFVVEDHMLKTEDGMGLLWYTREKIRDATVRVIFKFTHDNDDSGVFIRLPERPTDPWMAVNRGYEVEIGNWPDDYSCAGVLYTFSKALARPLRPTGEWNIMDITLDGPHTVVFLNDVKVTDYVEGQPVPAKVDPHDPDRGPRPASGFIGLQNYHDSTVYFREVSVKQLK